MRVFSFDLVAPSAHCRRALPTAQFAVGFRILLDLLGSHFLGLTHADIRVTTPPIASTALGTKALREQIRGMSEKLTKLKDAKDSATNDSEKNDLQKQIDELSKELEFKKKSLETDLSDIEITCRVLPYLDLRPI